jgi:hypothetical protein
MAITGRWITAQISVSSDGRMAFSAGIDLVDDTLGQVGHRGLTAPPEYAEAIGAQVRTFMEGLVPQVSALAGMPVTIAEAADTNAHKLT